MYGFIITEETKKEDNGIDWKSFFFLQFIPKKNAQKLICDVRRAHKETFPPYPVLRQGRTLSDAPGR